MQVLRKSLKYLISVAVASVLLTVAVDALETPDGPGGRLFRFWQKTEGPCPEGMAPVVSPQGDFCVDIYEASPSRQCDHQEIVGQFDTARNLEQARCQPVSESGRLPWIHVTRTQAQALCARAGKRLPGAAEWYYAALGTPDRGYGWGVDDCQVDNNWPDQPGFTGSGDNCRSGSGAYDMVGNVWEWLADEAYDGILDGHELPEQGFVRTVDTAGLPYETVRDPVAEMNNDYLWIRKTGLRQVARGGYSGNQDQAGVNAWYAVNEANFSGVGVGFRCVR